MNHICIGILFNQVYGVDVFDEMRLTMYVDHTAYGQPCVNWETALQSGNLR